MTSKSEIRAQWRDRLLSTEAADRSRAEDAVARLYSAAKFPAPTHFLWFDSPFEATWAVAALAESYHHIWRDKFTSGLSKNERRHLEATRASLRQRLGAGEWKTVLATVGAPRGTHLAWPPRAGGTFHTAFLEARSSLVGNVSELFTTYSDDDDLNRAESRFIGSNYGALRSALCCPVTDSLVGQSFFDEYSFSKMADDEFRSNGRNAPALLTAAWDVAQSAGLWWHFENAIVIADRPAEVYVNDKYVPHRGDGPAIVFRGGSRAFAWNGKTVPERWILEPESVQAREIKGFDPTFKKFLDSQVKGVAPTTPKKRAVKKSVLKTSLPLDAATRLEFLRASAGGSLPMFDRYRAGEHEAVWRELVAYGDGVRVDEHAADGLAVAYETMERVAANVDTLIDRLTTLGYNFQALGGVSRSTAQPRTRPAADVQETLMAFEKEFGTLPLSLRAFYEVVGSVTLNGIHSALSPASGPIAPDPLIVERFDGDMLEYDDDDSPMAIVIAPDDLHKANVSGGDPYEIAIPTLAADALLSNERHRLMFVDYLRLCFRFGGFPGYEGQSDIPSEIATLSSGLLAF